MSRLRKNRIGFKDEISYEGYKSKCRDYARRSTLEAARSAVKTLPTASIR